MKNELKGEYKDKFEEIFACFNLSILKCLHLENIDKTIKEYMKPELKNKMNVYQDS